MWFEVIDPFSLKEDFARSRGEETCQHGKRGGFACAVWPDHSNDFAGFHCEGEIVNGSQAVKIASEV
jgi:hypothetical protein